MISGPFLESPGNFSGRESCFVFVVFAFKIKASIVLKIIEWNYQLTKQNWLVYGLGTVLLKGLDFNLCLQARQVSGPFEKQAPGSDYPERAVRVQ